MNNIVSVSQFRFCSFSKSLHKNSLDVKSFPPMFLLSCFARGTSRSGTVMI